VIPLSFLEPRIERIEENTFKVSIVYTIKDLTEPYILVVGETSKIDKELSGGLGKLGTDLLNTLYDRLKDYMNTIEDIKELEKAVDDVLEQARKAWIEYKKVTGLRYKVVEAKLPLNQRYSLRRGLSKIVSFRRM